MEASKPTFESHWRDHESCPSHLVHYDDSTGWCDLHDEWWVLPDKEEVMDI